MTTDAYQKGHSEESFNEYRDFWWNEDFIDLMARRWKLQECQTLLDVGCGLCHWSLLLSRYLAKNAKVDGVDSDEKWVLLRPELHDRFSERGARLRLTQGSALDLPYETDSFDVVTCQTLLIHLEDPAAAIEEMVRVTKPGGLVVLAEPNNAAFSVMTDSLTSLGDIDTRLKLVELNMVYELGKNKRGLGFNSLGDRIAELLCKKGLHEIQVYQSDKTTPLLPPYCSKEQQALISGLEQWFDSQAGSFNREGVLQSIRGRWSRAREEVR